MRSVRPNLLSLQLLLLPILLLTAATAQLPPLEIPPGGATEVLPPSELPEEPANAFSGLGLAYSVLIENRVGGVVRVIEPPAQLLFNRPGDDIGQVVVPATRVLSVSDPAPGLPARSVTVSALSELRLKLYSDSVTGNAGEIVLLPASAPAAQIALAPASLQANAIQTTIAAGTGIFGGRYPLTVGSPLYVYRAGQRIAFNPGAEELQTGDVLIVEVAIPQQWPRELVVENAADGAVKLVTGEQVEQLGTVAKPAAATEPSAAALAGRRAGVVASRPGTLSLLFANTSTPVELELALATPLGAALPDALAVPAPAAGEAGFIADTVLPGTPTNAVAPPFATYIFPASGQEPPSGLPLIELLVQWKGSLAWLPPPLTFTAADLENLSAFKLAWRDPLAEPAAGEAIPGVEIGAAEPPSLREH